MRYKAASSGHQYNIEISGPDRGRPLLLLHGFTGDATSWPDLVSDMSDSLRPICLDILGHGKSDKPESVSSYHMPAVATDIINLLKQLNIAQSHLLGYSLGGRLALFLALRYPERFMSLLLESASPGLADESERADRRRRDNALADRIEQKRNESFVDYWERLPIWASQARLSQAVLKAQRNQRLRNDPRSLANSLRGMGSGAQPSLWHDLPTLTLPTRLLVGALDDKFRRINEAMAAKIPSATLDIIPSAGHNTHLENSAAFALAVRSFLQGI